jgi:hypothetical protein
MRAPQLHPPREPTARAITAVIAARAAEGLAPNKDVVHAEYGVRGGDEEPRWIIHQVRSVGLVGADYYRLGFWT